MSAELLILLLFIAAGWGVYQTVRAPAAPQRRATPLPTVRSSQRTPQVRRPVITPAMRQSARDLQLALMQLQQTPDFRRAASCALRAREVPVWFRQRQYRRFRPLIVRHLIHLLNRGHARNRPVPGLAQLIGALGIAEFEADYVRIEAESAVRTGQRDAPRPDFASRLRDVQAVHRERLQTLESLPDLDAESRELLIEQERMQFQERLRTLASEEGNLGAT